MTVFNQADLYLVILVLSLLQRKLDSLPNSAIGSRSCSLDDYVVASLEILKSYHIRGFIKNLQPDSRFTSNQVESANLLNVKTM